MSITRLVSDRTNMLLAQQQQQQQQQQEVIYAGPSLVDQPRRPFEDIRELSHKKKTASRFFVSEISGSPLSFAVNPDAAKAVVATEYSTKYRPHGSTIGSTRLGDPRRAYILHGKVVFAHNGYPFTVMVKSNAIRGRFYGPRDQRGYFAVPPNSTLSFPEGFDVLRPSQAYTSNVFKDFGHCTTDSYRDGVSKSKDGQWYTVTQGCVIHDILARNQNNPSQPYDLESPDYLESIDARAGVKRYRIPKVLYKSAKTCFLSSVLPKMPHTDFTSMWICIERLGGVAWDAPLGVFYYDSNECADQAVLSQHGVFSITHWFRYRLLYEEC